MTKTKNRYVKITCKEPKCGKEFTTRGSGIFAELELCTDCVVKIVKAR